MIRRSSSLSSSLPPTAQAVPCCRCALWTAGSVLEPDGTGDSCHGCWSQGHALGTASSVPDPRILCPRHRVSTPPGRRNAPPRLLERCFQPAQLPRVGGRGRCYLCRLLGSLFLLLCRYFPEMLRDSVQVFTLVLLLYAAVAWVRHRIAQDEMRTAEKLLEIELRLAEIGEDTKAGPPTDTSSPQHEPSA